MIVPSIDLMNGSAVQLIGGEKKELDAGDPRPIARKFRLAGEIAVIDLDAALGNGDNTDVVRRLVRSADCRVGGGIRSRERAEFWLNEGAAQIILGTAADPELLADLPRDRTIVALDAREGEVVVKGWTERTGQRVEARMEELRELCGGFLVTFVEKEGRMAGFDMDKARRLRDIAGSASLTIAGGVSTTEEVAQLDHLGIDAQVGMALYTERMNLADAIAAPLVSDRADGLWPTVVCDEHGIALGLAYSSQESLRSAVATQRGVYHSRSRGLWVKGASSGHEQELLGIALDCDRDSLRFTVRQSGDGFCHHNTRTCWGNDAGLASLARTLARRLEGAPAGSYTRRLLDDPSMLAAKLREETEELIDAESADDVVWETADVMYFALVRLIGSGRSLADVEAELARRARRVTRRPGNVKPRKDYDEE